jgi:hypothetical protein
MAASSRISSQPVEVVVRRARDFIRKRGRYDKPGKAN